MKKSNDAGLDEYALLVGHCLVPLPLPTCLFPRNKMPPSQQESAISQATEWASGPQGLSYQARCQVAQEGRVFGDTLGILRGTGFPATECGQSACRCPQAIRTLQEGWLSPEVLGNTCNTTPHLEEHRVIQDTVGGVDCRLRVPSPRACVPGQTSKRETGQTGFTRLTTLHSCLH